MTAVKGLGPILDADKRSLGVALNRLCGALYGQLAGAVDVIIGKGQKVPRIVATLFAGASYGELALVKAKARRTATIRASSDVYALQISKAMYEKHLQSMQEKVPPPRPDRIAVGMCPPTILPRALSRSFSLPYISV